MADNDDAPVIRVCRFHRDHTDQDNKQPPGQLHHDVQVKSLGFMRGRNLAVGQSVNVQTKDGIKKWSGSITSSVDDNWTPQEGKAWFFEVEIYQWEADPGTDDTVRV